jgi:benzoyl-CoA-dihydrodiol lyase
MDGVSATAPRVEFETGAYQHWRLTCDGPVATLTLDVREDAGIRPGYKLKLNSYDLGVDIELHDAIERIRFEHPEVRCVVITSAKPRTFCSGANIYMLGLSSHAWKVNFCKFTNETRNGMEDASEHSGLKFIAACNGATAGGGYELALACDEIVLIDDRSSAVSLPEVSTLAVLPGTGGLTRLTDKRKVRHDRADVFCTTPEGFYGQRAKEWGLVDAVVKPQDFQEYVRARALELAKSSGRLTEATGVRLTPLKRPFEYVSVELNRARRIATLTVSAPQTAEFRADASWWPLAMSRELDDTILDLRTNEPEIGLWILKTAGNPETVLAIDQFLWSHSSDWFVREVIGKMRRTFARLDVSARSIYAVIEPGSCFAGSLLELAFAADRVYMLDQGTSIALSEMNFGPLPKVNRIPRIFDVSLRSHIGGSLDASQALALGLITFAPDELDWDDELRLAMEERTALSPDALTGLEANLRFGGAETMETRIFGRLSAWQNWVFSRPNSTGPNGALKVYGSGNRPKFDPERT